MPRRKTINTAENILVAAVVLVILANIGYFRFTGSASLFSTPKPCNAEFNIDVTGTSGQNTCILTARISATNCQNNLVVRKDTCFGDFICNNPQNYDSVKSTCAWGVKKGAYSYVLCDGNTILSTKTVTC